MLFLNNFCSVIDTLGHQHNPTEWRLFLVSSKVSLKPLLQHNGNKFPLVLTTHVANMIMSYENMTLLWEKIQFEKYNWNICKDVEFIALFLGLQLCYTTFVALCVNGRVGTGNIITSRILA